MSGSPTSHGEPTCVHKANEVHFDRGAIVKKIQYAGRTELREFQGTL
jgi:hypothetical protein